MEIIKKNKKNAIILVIITFLVLFFVLKDDFTSVIEVLSRIDLKYIIIAIVLFLLSIVLKAYVTYLTVSDKKKLSLTEAVKHNIITQFFNGITPFSTGGQPMEIYMLTKHNIKVSEATNIIIQNFVFYQVALVLFGIFAVLYNATFHIFPKVPILQELVLIGFIINMLVAIVILFISFSSKFTEFCLKFITYFLDKIHLVRDKEKMRIKWKVRLNDFHNCARGLRKRKLLFIEGIIINFLSLACLYIVPLFIIYSVGEFSSITAMETLVSSAYVLIMGAFIPIPGASGGIEYGFLNFFGNFLNNTTTTTVLLIWRFITYYLGIIMGAIMFNFDSRSVDE